MADRRKTAFLVTGRPGCGKTTLIRGVVEGLRVPAGGFYTEEMREGGQRIGFRLITLDGREATLASVHSGSPYRVGRYGVELAAMEEVGVPALRQALEKGQILVADEIGKMELFSVAFREVLEEALERGVCLVGSIMLASHPFADALKRRPQVQLFQLREASRLRIREEMLGAVAGRLRAAER